MFYRCPECLHRLSIPKLFFTDISACKKCGQKVVLGDFVAMFVASISMMVMALSSLYILTAKLNDNVIAGGYALSAGMGTGIVVLFLLGRATPYKTIRGARAGGAPTGSAPLSGDSTRPAALTKPAGLTKPGPLGKN